MAGRSYACTGEDFLLVFFHSTSRPAVESLAHLQELGRKFGDRVNVVVVVRESPRPSAGSSARMPRAI
ncbi:MAG: hypothetical protein ACLSHL_10625 [Alistipes communis]